MRESESSRSQELINSQLYPSPRDSNHGSWYGNLESSSFIDDSQEFDAIASEYLDIDHYTLKDRYYDPYPFLII